MFRAIAIALSLLAAVALAFGAQFQNDSVIKNSDKNASDKHGVNLRHLVDLVKNPKWLGGMSFLVGGALCQITALTLAPLIVVQPIGALALVITSLLNARSTKTKITKATWVAIALCSSGIATFVALATGIASEQRKLSDSNLVILLGILAFILVAVAVLFFASKRKLNALTFIMGAGVLYGFVATLIKAIIQRIYQSHFEWLTVICVIAAIAAVSLGGWFVQNAYASGPPDLVIAGLTVIDPMVAVSIGIIVLGEAANASPLIMSVFIASGSVAALGVWLLSRVHPELQEQR